MLRASSSISNTAFQFVEASTVSCPAPEPWSRDPPDLCPARCSGPDVYVQLNDAHVDAHQVLRQVWSGSYWEVDPKLKAVWEHDLCQWLS